MAAATTSLPETLGGERNWDYRYCWLRDATLTLESLMRGGYHEEALAWRDWLLRAVAGDVSKLQIMYGPAGERRLDEWEVDWLPGYEGSTPVRIGNAASGQFQLDVYGEVLSALYEACAVGSPISSSAWDLQRALVDFVARNWDQPDEGIWEVRGPRRHFTHSKVMAWVAVDRAVRTVEEFELDGPLDDWRALRERIHDEVCTKGFNAIGRCVHPVLRVRCPRRQPAHDPARGVPAGYRRPRSAPPSRRSSVTSPRTASCCATAPRTPATWTG